MIKGDVEDIRHLIAFDDKTDVTGAVQPDVLPMSHHFRAARALLGWSMAVLAQKSKLSHSTVKRLEEDSALVSNKSRLRASVTLGEVGIRFLIINDFIVGVANVDEILSTVRKPPLPNSRANTDS